MPQRNVSDDWPANTQPLCSIREIRACDHRCAQVARVRQLKPGDQGGLAVGGALSLLVPRRRSLAGGVGYSPACGEGGLRAQLGRRHGAIRSRFAKSAETGCAKCPGARDRVGGAEEPDLTAPRWGSRTCGSLREGATSGNWLQARMATDLVAASVSDGVFCGEETVDDRSIGGLLPLTAL